MLYIILFLHQTTTYGGSWPIAAGCISSFSYIKPQPIRLPARHRPCCISSFSYIKPQQEVKRMFYAVSCISSFSYIKPQLSCYKHTTHKSCISSFSYIKPQHKLLSYSYKLVVYHPFPTSNHN